MEELQLKGLGYGQGMVLLIVGIETNQRLLTVSILYHSVFQAL